MNKQNEKISYGGFANFIDSNSNAENSVFAETTAKTDNLSFFLKSNPLITYTIISDEDNQEEIVNQNEEKENNL